MINKNWLIAIALVVGLGIGFMLHKKIVDPSIPEPWDTHKIDSLMEVNRTLQDTLADVRAEIRQIAPTVIKYKHDYDTIVMYTESDQLIQSLRAIANTPVK